MTFSELVNSISTAQGELLKEMARDLYRYLLRYQIGISSSKSYKIWSQTAPGIDDLEEIKLYTIQMYVVILTLEKADTLIAEITVKFATLLVKSITPPKYEDKMAQEVAPAEVAPAEEDPVRCVLAPYKSPLMEFVESTPGYCVRMEPVPQPVPCLFASEVPAHCLLMPNDDPVCCLLARGHMDNMWDIGLRMFEEISKNKNNVATSQNQMEAIARRYTPAFAVGGVDDIMINNINNIVNVIDHYAPDNEYGDNNGNDNDDDLYD
tara:strand:- start:501 stop:1295 length:795 start_codon:yes stop_codon:yes gene_type:complete